MAQWVNSGMIDKGTVGNGTTTFSGSLASIQKLTCSASQTIAFSTGWAPAGVYAELMIIMVNGSTGNPSWPTVNWFIGDGTTSTTFSNMGVTLSTGVNRIVCWTIDGCVTTYGSAQ